MSMGSFPVLTQCVHLGGSKTTPLWEKKETGAQDLDSEMRERHRLPVHSGLHTPLAISPTVNTVCVHESLFTFNSN